MSKIRLFNQWLSPETETSIVIDPYTTHKYIFYTGVYHKDLFFRLWCLYPGESLGFPMYYVYGFSVYENGRILSPAKDKRFSGTHSMHFRQKEWSECYFETMAMMLSFIQCCSL